MTEVPEQQSVSAWLQSLSKDQFLEVRRAIRQEAARRGVITPASKKAGGAGRRKKGEGAQQGE